MRQKRANIKPSLTEFFEKFINNHFAMANTDIQGGVVAHAWGCTNGSTVALEIGLITQTL